MKNMTLDNVASFVGGTLIYPDNFKPSDRVAAGVVIDNRLVEQDYIFVPIKGERVDGHKFIPQAFADGALCVLTEQDDEITQGPYIRVESTTQALKMLATGYRMQLDIPIIGIIGSVGKTSTKEMVASVLSEKYNVQKTAGNLNNEIGLPLTLLSIKEEHEIAVVEMGISDFGEMDRLGMMAKPDAVIYTNIGDCHLEDLKDRDGVLRAKTEVFAHLAEGATVFVNNDDDKLRTVSEASFEPSKHISVVRFSMHDTDCDYRADNIVNHGLDGIDLTVSGGFNGDVHIPLPGMFNVSNALAAIACAVLYGLDDEQIAAGVLRATTIAGRSNFIKTDDITIIDDCYNANPMSMKASLGVLGFAIGRKVAILGDMGELGDNEVALHKSVAEAVTDNNCDVLVTVGKLSRNISDAVSESRAEVKTYAFDDVDSALSQIDSVIKKGDTVLVKASHFMNFSRIVDRLKTDN